MAAVDVTLFLVTCSNGAVVTVKTPLPIFLVIHLGKRIFFVIFVATYFPKRLDVMTLSQHYVAKVQKRVFFFFFFENKM